jgi:hypothetical protein
MRRKSRKQGGEGEAGNSDEKKREGNREEREKQETVRRRKSRKLGGQGEAGNSNEKKNKQTGRRGRGRKQ